MRLLIVTLGLLLASSSALSWETRNGSQIRGKFDSFNFKTKELVFSDPVNPPDRHVPFEDLSLRSQQRLLFSPVYHRSFPDDSLWPTEKKMLLLVSGTAVIVPLLLGFWISGILIARKFNPIHALIGFVGSWIIGSVLVATYLILSSQFDGNATLLGAGFIVASIFLSILVSAIYNCHTFKGFAILFSHLLIGTLLALICLAATNLLLPKESLDELWNHLVFRAVGLASPAS